MSDPVFTTALYIFSSLVQADAAILSLGAIFVIYRLQTLSSAYDSAMAWGYGAFRGNHESLLMLGMSNSNPEKAAILMGWNESPYRSLVATIAHTADWRRGAVRASLPLLWFLAIHCSLTAIFLLAMPAFIARADYFPLAWMVADVSLFVVLIIFVTVRVYRMLAIQQISASTFFPDISMPLPVDFADLRALFPKNKFSRLYQFEIRGNKFFLKIDRISTGPIFFQFPDLDDRRKQDSISGIIRPQTQDELLQHLGRDS